MTVNIDMGREPAAGGGAGFRCRLFEAAGFGAELEFETDDIGAIVACCKRHASQILCQFYAARGFPVLRGMQQIRDRPRALVELSRLFGPEVENYCQTLTSPRFFHESIDEILILGNQPPCNHAPPPQARRDAAGMLVQYPQQKNWHTDQRYRRPPPDITLLFAVELPPPEQGQTLFALFADCGAAWSGLGKERQRELESWHGIHAPVAASWPRWNLPERRHARGARRG